MLSLRKSSALFLTDFECSPKPGPEGEPLECTIARGAVMATVAATVGLDTPTAHSLEDVPTTTAQAEVPDGACRGARGRHVGEPLFVRG